jgi:hypothetical protein
MDTLEAQVYVTQMSLMQLCCMEIGGLGDWGIEPIGGHVSLSTF